MTILVGAAGGGAGLYLPESARLGSLLDIKTSAGATASSEVAAFWTAVDLSHTFLGWESVKLSAAADTTEQTIVDTSIPGVLTHVVAPELSGSGIMTIRVTINGDVKTFVSETISATDRFCLGMFYPWNAGATDLAYGCASDEGFGVTSAQNYMPTSIDAVNEGLGLKYNTLKVTIQGSVNITATANKLNGCANHTLSIPEGL